MSMICLAIDTAGNACAACLFDSSRDEILSEITEEIGKGHAERLMGLIGEVMEEAGITYQDIEKIITSTGPGSFTGIRVGVATARGFGLGLSVPVVGVNNLEALICELMEKNDANADEKFGVLLSAGRNQVYGLLSFDTPLAPAGKPFAAETTDVKAALGTPADVTLCGNGVEMVVGRGFSGRTCHQAEISTIARMGASREANGTKPEPLYLRKPDAKPQSGFAIERAG